MQIDWLLNDFVNSWLLQRSYIAWAFITWRGGGGGVSFFSDVIHKIWNTGFVLFIKRASCVSSKIQSSMPGVISLLINLVLLTLNKAATNERRTSRIFYFFQDVFELVCITEAISSPKLTSSNGFLITVAVVFTTLIYRREFIISCTSIDKKKSNNDTVILIDHVRDVWRRKSPSLINYRFHERKTVLPFVPFCFGCCFCWRITCWISSIPIPNMIWVTVFMTVKICCKNFSWSVKSLSVDFLLVTSC